MLHPSVIEGLKLQENENSDSVEIVRGESITFPHPRLEDVIIENAKALGIHFKMDLTAERSYLTFAHWSVKDETLTKRNVARSYARCWNPLFALAPITNPAKIAISKMWELNNFFQKTISAEQI